LAVSTKTANYLDKHRVEKDIEAEKGIKLPPIQEDTISASDVSEDKTKLPWTELFKGKLLK